MSSVKGSMRGRGVYRSTTTCVRSRRARHAVGEREPATGPTRARDRGCRRSPSRSRCSRRRRARGERRARPWAGEAAQFRCVEAHAGVRRRSTAARRGPRRARRAARRRHRSSSAVRAIVGITSRPVAPSERRAAPRAARRCAGRRCRRSSRRPGDAAAASGTRASVSARRTSSSGRTRLPAIGSIPVSPSSPQPRTSASSTVSARSSIVWPSAWRSAPIRSATVPAAARRSSRAHRSTESPGAGARPRSHHVAVQTVGGGATPDVGGVGRRAGPEPVIQMEHREPDPEQPADAERGSRAGRRSRPRPRPTRGSADRARTGRGLARCASRARSPAPPPAAGASRRYPATRAIQRSGSPISPGCGRFPGAAQTRLKPLMPTRSTTSCTKRSPASYCATF